MFRLLLLLLLTGITYSTYPSEANLCGDCHQEQLHQWLASDHSNAMAIASENTVLGDFNDITFEHFNQKATFYKKGKKFFIEF